MLRLSPSARALFPLVGGALLLAGALPVHAQDGRRGGSCQSARTAAQWQAHCHRQGKLGITVVGGRGQHVLRGSAANDTIFGGGGRQTLYGLAGNDRLVAGPASDRIFPGRGNDLVQARNGFRDVVTCAQGHDIVLADRIDTVRRCAVVLRGPKLTGSRAHPVPLGSPAQLGNGWRVRVTETTPRGDQRVLAAGKGQNSPPPKGRQFFLIKISATRTASSRARLYAGYRFRSSPSTRRTYTTFDDPCGILPSPDLEIVNDPVRHGQTVSGYVCWDVRKRDARKLLMFNAGGFDGGRQVYFALH